MKNKKRFLSIIVILAILGGASYYFFFNNKFEGEWYLTNDDESEESLGVLNISGDKAWFSEGTRSDDVYRTYEFLKANKNVYRMTYVEHKGTWHSLKEDYIVYLKDGEIYLFDDLDYDRKLFAIGQRIK